jgi:hypothetical protein
VSSLSIFILNNNERQIKYYMKKYLLYILLPLNTFAQIVVTNGLTQTFQSNAKGQIVGQIKLRNIGKKTETFLSSKQNVIFECGSYGTFSDTKTHDRSLIDWIEFDVDEKELTPNQEFNLVFRINFPDDVSGTYWGAVMIEYGDPTQNLTGLKIENKARYAVQIIANIGSYEAPKLVYNKVFITNEGKSSKIIQVELENTGFFSANVKTQLELYDERGTKIQTIKGEIKNIYPSRCNTYNIEVKNLRPGKYDGVILSDTGKKIYGSNISLKIE